MSTAPEIPNLMEAIVSLSKRRGFVFPSSDIYGGFNGFFDYGPLGVELKKNIRDCWWNDMVRRREDIVGLESSIIMAGFWTRSWLYRSFGRLQSLETTLPR